VVSHPEILEKLADDIADIQNHNKQGTGEWRAVQAKAYWPFIQENIVVGMRFKGFELPIQFYDPEQPWLVVFPDGHGHFFHSFYIDSLFYLGAIGLLLLCMPQLYTLGQIVRRPPLDPEAITWSIFIISSLVYGYSYALPAYFYGVAGLGFVRIKHLAKPYMDLPVQELPAAEKTSASVPASYPA
jgi:hypothetical protein